MSLRDALVAELDALAREGRTVGYADLARRLGLAPPGTIAQLTEALETLMAEEAAAGQPFRAALCQGRLRGGLPGPGFFRTARALGRYHGPEDGPEAVAFVAAEWAALFKG